MKIENLKQLRDELNKFSDEDLERSGAIVRCEEYGRKIEKHMKIKKTTIVFWIYPTLFILDICISLFLKYKWRILRNGSKQALQNFILNP